MLFPIQFTDNEIIKTIHDYSFPTVKQHLDNLLPNKRLIDITPTEYAINMLQYNTEQQKLILTRKTLFRKNEQGIVEPEYGAPIFIDSNKLMRFLDLKVKLIQDQLLTALQETTIKILAAKSPINIDKAMYFERVDCSHKTSPIVNKLNKSTRGLVSYYTGWGYSKYNKKIFTKQLIEWLSKENYAHTMRFYPRKFSINDFNTMLMCKQTFGNTFPYTHYDPLHVYRFRASSLYNSYSKRLGIIQDGAHDRLKPCTESWISQMSMKYVREIHINQIESFAYNLEYHKPKVMPTYTASLYLSRLIPTQELFHEICKNSRETLRTRTMTQKELMRKYATRIRM